MVKVGWDHIREVVGSFLFHAALAFVLFHYVGVRMHLEVEIYRVLVDVLRRVLSLQEWGLFDIVWPVLDAVVPPL